MDSSQRERIVVLVVDDIGLSRCDLKRAFEVADCDDFEFVVHTACNAGEYRAVINACHVDVLVVDIRLDPKEGASGGVAEDGTDDIIAFHHLHSPDTIIIAYSAFDGLDAVENTVRAMRAGAVDCIARSRPGFLGIVVARAVDELRRRRSPESGPSPEWLEANLPRLIQQFGGQAIAISGERVIMSANSVQELRQKLADAPQPVSPFLMVVPDWRDNAC